MSTDQNVAVYKAGELTGKIKALEEYKEALLGLISKTQGTRYGHIDYMDVINVYEAIMEDLKREKLS